MDLNLSENMQKVLKYGLIAVGVVIIGGVAYKAYSNGNKQTLVPVKRKALNGVPKKKVTKKRTVKKHNRKQKVMKLK